MLGGNTKAVIQSKTTENNEIGEQVDTWKDEISLKGWLDFTGGGVANKYSGKFEETTHIFMCDYQSISITASQCRLISDNKIYEVLLIDDPMNLHEHIEILLKFIEVLNA